ncbi:DUF6777 domain-containing protein [Actinocorallia aurea]
MLFLVLLLAAGATGCAGAGTVITRLAVGDPGPDAYTVVAGTDQGDVGRLASAGGAKPGDEPGLYGGSRQDAVCDKDALVDFLEGDQAKAGAWAASQGISPEGIAEFVDGLTPVLLRADTLVTNHGYRDGKATKMAAVLQAGIAVMVDSRGVPVVKCNCGNPLSAPEEGAPEGEFTGASWPQFSPDKVTVVSAPDAEIEELTLVDTAEDEAFDRPVGTGGEADGAPEPVPPAAAAEPPAPPASDPSQTGPTGPDGAEPSDAPAETPVDPAPATPEEEDGTTQTTAIPDPSEAQSVAPDDPDPAEEQPADDPPPNADASQPADPPAPQPEDPDPTPPEPDATG